jgi:sec-independent protein translocase protein TatB
MFDIGFSELLVIGVVALVVLGPERLPKVARTAGHLFGRLQRYVATVKADLNREMEMSEFSKVRQEVQDAARAFEQSAQQTTASMETEARALSESIEKAAAPATATEAAAPVTQTELLTAQEQALSDTPVSAAQESVSATAVKCASEKPRQSAANMTAPAHQGMLDFGIEPIRSLQKANAAPASPRL